MKYLLSPQDLMAVERVPELIAAGVACFKIEGRLKGPEYVALTTKVYRNAVDAAWEALHGGGVGRTEGADASRMAAAKDAVKLEDRTRWDLEQVRIPPANDSSKAYVWIIFGISHGIMGMEHVWYLFLAITLKLGGKDWPVLQVRFNAPV